MGYDEGIKFAWLNVFLKVLFTFNLYLVYTIKRMSNWNLILRLSDEKHNVDKELLIEKRRYN